MNMTISGVGAFSGSVRHGIAGRISWKLVLLIGIPSALGAIFGMWFMIHIPRFWGHLAIGTMLFVSGLNLLVQRTDANPTWRIPPHLVIAIEILVGVAIGALASITGLLLGSLRLPIMIRVLQIDPPLATGSNMVISCATAFAGAATSLVVGTEHGILSVIALAVVAPPTIVGGYFGAKFTDRLSKDQLIKLVGWTVAATGVLMVIQGFWQALDYLDLENDSDIE